MLGVKGSRGQIGRYLFGFFLILYFAYPGYAQGISNMKSLLSEQGQVLFGDEPNSILVIDYPENIERVNEYLRMVDVQPQQVHIEARIVEVKLQGETSLGIDWTAFANSGGLNFGNFDMFSGTAASGITTAGVIDYDTFSKIKDPAISGSSSNTDPFTLTLSQNNINLVMRALANNYDTDILSAPSITTINNHEAIIKMTDIYPWALPTVTPVEGSNPEISYEMNFEEAGITLQVIPTISENGKIIMNLRPEISEKTNDYDVTIDPGGGSQTITYTVPIIETRQAETKVVIGSGETLIIGGLIKNKEIESEIKIPLLGDIPYLGYLFKTQRKTIDKKELVIFVSPTIINAPEMEYGRKLEKKIRKDLEGTKTKLELIPMKEVGPKKEIKDAARAEAEKIDQEAQIAQAKREKEALRKKVESLYAQAVSAYADGNLKKAKGFFQRVLRYNPVHKKSLSFLETKIPQGLKEIAAQDRETKAARKVKVEPVQKKRKRLEAKCKKRDALKKETATTWRKARERQAGLEKQEAIARQKKRQADKEAAEAQRQTALRAKKLYSEAVSFYRKKDYFAAQLKLQKLDVFSPGYGRSEVYLAKIPGLIEADRQAKKSKEVKEKGLAMKARAKDSYKIAISLYKLKKYKEALTKFQEIQKLTPGYRETTYYLNKIPEIIKRKKRADQLRYQKDRQQVIREILDAVE